MVLAEEMEKVSRLEAELAESEARVERLKESNRKLAPLIRLASGPQVPEEAVDYVIALAREDLMPGDLGDETGEG